MKGNIRTCVYTSTPVIHLSLHYKLLGPQLGAPKHPHISDIWYPLDPKPFIWYPLDPKPLTSYHCCLRLYIHCMLSLVVIECH